MSNSESEFKGNIVSVRAVEDCIRATKKYTEGIGTMRAKAPVQGEDFPSKVFCKYYEVYPHVDLNKKRSLLDAIGASVEWLSGYSTHIDVVFRYDYRADKASVTIKDGIAAIKELRLEIPGFHNALVAVANGAR